MQDTLTQADLDLLDQWGVCEKSAEYRKVGQSLSEIPIEYRNWVFWRAAQKGNLTVIDRLLRAGITQWTIDDAFYWAAQNGHLEVVRRLLEVGMSQQTINEALWWTKSYKHTEIAELLEKHLTSNPI